MVLRSGVKRPRINTTVDVSVRGDATWLKLKLRLSKRVSPYTASCFASALCSVTAGREVHRWRWMSLDLSVLS